MSVPGLTPPPPVKPKRIKGWQPLSFRGCAAFAASKWRRVVVLQIIISQICAALVFWTVWHAWVPVVEEGLDKLPEDAHFAKGTLTWQGEPVQVLAENRFLGLRLGIERSESLSDVRLGFGPTEWQVCSILGCYLIPYAQNVQAFPVNPIDTRSAWEAWRGMIYTGFWLGVTLFLLLSWWFLSFLYSIPLSIAAYFTDRAGGWAGTFKMCGAALMPAALIFSAAITLYGVGGLDLLGLAVAMVLHLVLQWVYVLGAFWRMPKLVQALESQKNPFSSSPS